MKFALMNSSCVYVEIGQTSLKLLHGEEGFELPVDRLENGRLTPACREKVTSGLSAALKRKSWQPRLRAICAINARGVSLRSLKVPASNPQELQRVLRLQIESEFPLTPEELAWGWQRSHAAQQQKQAGTNQELIVVAVKKDVLQEYFDLLSACGLNPVFTLGALARSWVCPQPAGAYAVLDIGRSHSELTTFENGVPTSLRIVAWGGENITRAIAGQLRVTRDEAEKLKTKLEQEPVAIGQIGQAVQSAIGTALDELAASMRGNFSAQKLYVTGRSTRLKDLAPRFGKALGPLVDCERVELMPGPGRSAAILGVKRSFEKDGGLPLTIQLTETAGKESLARPELRKWATVAALLLLGLVTLPYAEALLLKPRLVHRLDAVKADLGRLPVIDHELNFLQYLKENQSPYLDTLYVMSKAAPQGTRLDSISMNRRGELAFRGTLQNSQQVTDFRSKLIESGLFSAVTVEEQTPSPDRQKVTVRMTAQWKPANERASLSFEPSPQEIEKAKAAAKDAKSTGPMEGNMPPGMPGFPMPFAVPNQ